MREGRLITGDAMSCPRDLSQEVRDAEGHHLGVGRGQPTDAPGRDPGRIGPFRGRGLSPLGGRKSGVTRWARRRPSTKDTVVGDVARAATTALSADLDRPGVAPVGQVTCREDQDGERTEATRDFLTGGPRTVAGASAFLPWGRGHRSIEDGSHPVRDVTLGEDASRIRRGSGPEGMAAVRNVAIGFLRSTGLTDVAAALRRDAARVEELFAKPGILKR